jgi:hypothetical protein
MFVTLFCDDRGQYRVVYSQAKDNVAHLERIQSVLENYRARQLNQRVFPISDIRVNFSKLDPNRPVFWLVYVEQPVGKMIMRGFFVANERDSLMRRYRVEKKHTIITQFTTLGIINADSDNEIPRN